MSRLPDKYRVAIVLCDLQGKTRKEAARQLRLPEGTVAGRLRRGRALLAKRLARHGLAVSAGALAAVLSQKAASAGVPISVVSSTIKAASMFVAGQLAAAAAISVNVAALSDGVMKGLLLTKLKIPPALVVALAITGTGVAHRFLKTQGAGAAATVQRPEREFSGVGGQAASPQQQGASKTAAARSQEFLNDALKEFQAAGEETGALPHLPHRLMADMAGLQARLGDRDAARRLYERATAIVAAMAESNQSGEWRMLAQAAASAGEVEEAIATTLRIPKGNQYRDLAFQEVATELAKKRQEKEALRVGAMVEDEEKKSSIGPVLLEDLALAHAAAGSIPEALRVAERMKDPSSRVTVLLGRIYFNMSFFEYPEKLGVALLQAKAEDKALARKTLERAAELIASMPEDNTPCKARALTALACAQARLGEFATARKTVEGI